MGIGQSNLVKVVFFTRKQRLLGNFSVEIYFKLVKQYLPSNFQVEIREMPFYSNGILRRLGNAIYCFFHQSDINHITGDIHYVSFFLKKKKTVLTILDCGMLHQSKGIKHFIYKWLWFKIPIFKVSYVTAISESTKRDIIKYTNCSPSKVKVVYVCINPDFKMNPKDFFHEKPHILQIGTAPNKNLINLIPALNGINCKLVIIGKLDSNLINLLKVHNIDYKLISERLTNDQIIDQYEKSDIVALISTLEGFGMPIVEANKVGRVVICGNNSSMPEVAGNAAKLTNSLDVQDIKNGINEIITNYELRETLIKNGFRNAERFSPKMIANQYAEIYNQIVS
jgi:glycosyltransferase involved in cell wall biosynthesis